MVLVVCMSQKERRSYFNSCVKRARSVLRGFPTLNRLLDGFSSMTNLRALDTGNAIFWKCKWGYGRRIEELTELNRLEDNLRKLRVSKWSSHRQRELLPRLRSHKGEQVASVLAEIEVGAYYNNRLGKGGVIFYPLAPKKGPDLKVKLVRQSILFEITTVNTGIVESQIKVIYDAIAKEVFRRSRKRRTLKMEIESSRLVRDHLEHIDVNGSVRKIAEFMDRVGLWSLLDSIDSLDLLSLSRIPSNNTLYESKDMLADYSPEFLGSLKRTEVAAFAKRVKPLDLAESPIVNLYSWKAKKRMVEVSSKMQYPSESSVAEQGSFLDRLARSIRCKTQGGQLQTGHPNIIVVKASNWITSGYEHGEGLTADISYEPIQKAIENTLINTNPDLSAVMVYEHDFDRSRIFLNRRASPASSLSKAEKLKLYGRARIREFKDRKSALRVRRRADPRKVSYCRNSIKEEYESSSRTREVFRTRMFDPIRDAGKEFKTIGIRLQVDRDWFRDPTFIPDFMAIGRELAIAEERYIVSGIASNSERMVLPKLDRGSLEQAIREFSKEAGPPSRLFSPFSFYVEIHGWRTSTGRPFVQYDDGHSQLLLSDGSRIGLEFTKALGDRVCLVYNMRSHGELVYKPGSSGGALSLSLNPNRKNRSKVNLYARTCHSYRVEHPKAARVLEMARPQGLTGAQLRICG